MLVRVAGPSEAQQLKDQRQPRGYLVSRFACILPAATAASFSVCNRLVSPVTSKNVATSSSVKTLVTLNTCLQEKVIGELAALAQCCMEMCLLGPHPTWRPLCVAFICFLIAVNEVLQYVCNALRRMQHVWQKECRDPALLTCRFRNTASEHLTWESCLPQSDSYRNLKPQGKVDSLRY